MEPYSLSFLTTMNIYSIWNQYSQVVSIDYGEES